MIWQEIKNILIQVTSHSMHEDVKNTENNYLKKHKAFYFLFDLFDNPLR